MTPTAMNVVVVTETGQGRFQQEIRVGEHRLIADEPAEVGGLDSGPGPYDLLLAALGACTAMTLRLYAERKALPLDSVTVRLTHSKIYAADCAELQYQGRDARSDRSRDHAFGEPRRKPARSAYGDRRQVPRAPNAHLGSRDQNGRGELI